METYSMNTHFCVFVGWVPGVYTSHDDLSMQLQDFENSCWMPFPTQEKAEEAYADFVGGGDPAKGRKLIAKGKLPPPTQPPSTCQAQRVTLQALRACYLQNCNRSGNNPTPDQFVPAKPNRIQHATVNMTKLLSKACKTLVIPAPIYHSITETSQHGRRLYHHLVSAVPSGSSEALVVQGRLAYNPAVSKDDCARICIRRLCQTLDAYIYDYNFTVVDQWKERFANIAQDLASTETRLEEPTRYKDALRQAFNRSKSTSHGSANGATPSDSGSMG